MAPRSIWKGAMGFGMVSVPVKLYSSTDEKTVHFNQLHRDCNTRIQVPKFCPTCDRKVEQAELVKGYPVGDNQYVLMDEADFANLPVKSLKSIDVVAFVEGGQIDPRHYKSSYFLAPDDAGVKAFSLFLQAMGKVNMVGICKLGYREREHLATIRAYGGVILLQTLYYADELRNADEVAPKLADVSEREMEMAITLLQTLQTPKPNLDQYEDEYRKTLLKVIEAKLNGVTLSVEAPKEEPKMDLVDALMASINQSKEKKAEAEGTLSERIEEIKTAEVN
ncbi:Non-homologous end joining protein Ku [subsurface metagenome]